MTISRSSEPDEVGSIVVGTKPNGTDAGAADGLVDRNYAAVYRYAYRLTGSATAAEDVTQETFIQAIAHLHQLRVREAEGGWMLSIARRQFMRWLRDAARPVHGRTVPLAADEGTIAGDPIKDLDDKDWVQLALALLNQDVRVALLMYYFEDLSYAEISQQLQVPIGTVMSRLSRGREQLRQALTRLAATPSDRRSTDRGDASQGLVTPPNLVGPAGANPLAQEVKHG